MAVSNIPDEHHVVRHCKKREVIRKDGVAIGVFPEALLLRPANPPKRPNPETYLSANYYEHFTGTGLQKMKACCQALAFTPKPNDALARFNVKLVKDIFQERSLGIRVTHEPKTHNGSYAAIRPQKMEIKTAAVVASDALVEIVEVKSL